MLYLVVSRYVVCPELLQGLHDGRGVESHAAKLKSKRRRRRTYDDKSR